MGRARGAAGDNTMNTWVGSEKEAGEGLVTGSISGGRLAGVVAPVV